MANQHRRGQVLSVRQVWGLAQQWYGNRLAPEYHGRTLVQVAAIFKQLGLVSPFWYMSEDAPPEPAELS